MNNTNGELDPLPMCTYNDFDIFISENTRQKIWNLEYVDMALLLKQNYCPSYDTQGTLTVNNNQLSIKAGTPRIKEHRKHKEKITELLKYMTIIRGAASSNPLHRWANYDMQFRLRMSKDPSRSWDTIYGHLWLSCGLSGDLAASTISTGPCYEYNFNFKGFCTRVNCNYSHTCIKCKVQHPASTCNLFKESKFQSTYKNARFSNNPYNATFRSAAPAVNPVQPNHQQNTQVAAPVFSPVQQYFQPRHVNHFSRPANPRQQGARPFRPSNFRSQGRYMGPRSNTY